MLSSPALWLLLPPTQLISGRNGPLEQAREAWQLLGDIGSHPSCRRSLRAAAKQLPSTLPYWLPTQARGLPLPMPPLLLNLHLGMQTLPFLSPQAEPVWLPQLLPPGSLSLDRKGRRSAEVSSRCCCFPTSSPAWLSRVAASGPDPERAAAPAASCLGQWTLTPGGWQPLKMHRKAIWSNSWQGPLEPNRQCSTSVPLPHCSSSCSRQPPSPRKAGS